MIIQNKVAKIVILLLVLAIVSISFLFSLRENNRFTDRILDTQLILKTWLAKLVQGVITITGFVVGPEEDLPTIPTRVIFKGWAYPLSKVVVLRDGQRFLKTQANVQAKFRTEISNITPGIYTFGIWAEDKDKRRSITYTLTFRVRANTIHEISGIFLPPTIELSKTALLRGQTLNIIGQTVPKSEVKIYIDSFSPEIIKKIRANEFGAWFLSFNTQPLEEGAHTAKARSQISPEIISNFSHILSFAIGPSPPVPPGKCCGADINCDSRVNLVDFSIMLYFWRQAKPTNVCADINQDGVVNLVDFSIMLYWWTG